MIELLRESRRRFMQAALEIYHIERLISSGQVPCDFDLARVRRDGSAGLQHFNSSFPSLTADRARIGEAADALALALTPQAPPEPMGAIPDEDLDAIITPEGRAEFNMSRGA